MIDDRRLKLLLGVSLALNLFLVGIGIGVGVMGARMLRDRMQLRPPAVWEATMARLEECARGQENLLPPMIEAVKAYATVGEICDRLRGVWGEHRELITI